ncbi:MAG TPA: hypothetical protein VK689_11585 [Armatimonadota bacterium]|nr:hypothetical protein [Armatimonadota bacterium]
MMMRTLLSRTLPFLCAGVLLAAPLALRAQSAAGLAPGTRVRVVDHATGRTVGTVSEVRGDTLVVLAGRGERRREVTLSVSSLRRLQVSRGRPSRPVSALQLGALGLVSGTVGGLAGATLPSLLSGERCDRRVDDLCFTTGESVAIGLLVGAPMGFALGAVAGFLFPQERWHSLSLPNAPVVTVSGHGDGVRLGLSIPLP